MSEDGGLLGRFRKLLGASIRGQILGVLVALLFLGSITQALTFYVKSRSVTLEQLRGSYQSLGLTVGKLSVYDLQFNRQGLAGTTEGLLGGDENLLWVEFADPAGKTLASGGPLGASPYTLSGGLAPDTSVTSLGTAKGKALLVRVPVRKAAEAAPSGDTGLEMGFGTLAPGPSGPVDLGELRLVVGLSGLEELRRGYLVFGLLALLATMALGTLAAFYISGYITAPLSRLTTMAQKLAGGDFTGLKGQGRRQDELGRLQDSFREMGARLSSTVRDIRRAFQSVQVETHAVRGQLDRNVALTQEQDQAKDAVAHSLTAIRTAVDEVSRQMESLSLLAEEVSSSVLEMITSIEEIAGSADGLTDSVNRAASTLSQNVAAQKEISASTETLNRFVEETSAAMTEMEGNIREIERNALQTRQATENVALEARSGVQAVERSQSSVQGLAGSFAKTVEAMRLLGQRSEEVGQILSVIDEVMDQTHLLALNAAIIAAQAGEHGKSFAVVAGEIRNLAEKTSLSTREIADLVASVQAEVHKAVESVSSQTVALEESVSASSESAASFKRIEDSVKPALQQVQEIARATNEQSRSAAAVARSVEQVRDLAHQVGRATREQSAGSDQILDAVNRIRNLAEEVKRATREQSAGSALIREAMDRLTSAVGTVLAQAATQGEAARGGSKALEGFDKASRASLANIAEANRKMEDLAGRAEDVGRELGRFQTEE